MEDFKQENLYVGSQIFLESDRLVFSGRDDSVFSSKKRFLFKTDGDFHINTRKDVFINTPKIYLGPVQDNKDPNIPAVKSDELKTLLKDIITALKTWTIEYGMGTSGLMGPNPAVNQPIGQSLYNRLTQIEQKLDNIDSNVVFIR